MKVLLPRLCLWAVPVVALFAASMTCAADHAKALPTLDFLRDIRPILSNKCYRCHGPGTQKGELRLDTRERALRDEVVVPGKTDVSKLIARIEAADDERMPPADAGDRLSPAEVAKLRMWIEQGAEWAAHWAYAPPKRAPLPQVRRPDQLRSPIDAWVVARLDQANLEPSPEASRATLIRRVYLDLLGLLPDVADVIDFTTDDRPDAYQRLIDRVLASPALGERQARHWLDMARYADSNGFTIDGARSMWPYRDWVIQALNRDLPFDQFTAEQLAGDLLPNGTPEQMIATGFHRNTPFNEEGGTDPEQFRVERTVDRTNTTGAVWLGLTVGCAQCHDHKYDQISQREYYQLYAFFNHADEAPPMRMPTPEQTKSLDQLRDKLKIASDQHAALTKKSAVAAKAGTKATETPPTNEALAALEKETGDGWNVLTPSIATSAHGAIMSFLSDKSVLAGGPVPDTDVYTVRFESVPGTFHGVRLEALTHESLPQNGPGRAGHGNFVLSHFEFAVDGKKHDFVAANADHQQSGYEARDILLGDPKRGWAINTKDAPMNVDRQVVFVAENPIEIKAGQVLTAVLKFSEQPKKYTLGRFRVALNNASARVVSLPIAAQQILSIEPEKRTSEQSKSLNELVTPPPEDASLQQELSNLAKEVKQLKDQVQKFEKTVRSTLVFKPPTKPRITNIQLRGDFLNRGDEVQPGTLATLPSLDNGGRVANRLDLAQWLCRSDQPLTPRVVVNRLWQQYFGKGLVETENDFGMQGDLPTHPELLDWLAVDFVGNEPESASQPSLSRWSQKQIHREILSSATYRQASVERRDLREKDPYNKLLGRQNRLRLEAEIIRDVALAAAGLLSRTQGGPGVYPPLPVEVFSFTQARKDWPESQGGDRYRRGIYTYLWRQSLHPLLTTFDGAEAQTTCTKRNRSNTPLQALHLANDPAFIEIAEGLARRVQAELPLENDAARLHYAYQVCYGRSPTHDEQQRFLKFVETQKESNAATTWVMVARVLMNLDEFICRE